MSADWKFVTYKKVGGDLCNKLLFFDLSVEADFEMREWFREDCKLFENSGYCLNEEDGFE